MRPAPRRAALSPEFLAKQGIQSMPADGIHSVTVPGAVDGWAKMHQRFGKLPWKDLFQAAIAYAEQGFPGDRSIQRILGRDADRLQAHPESLRVFLPGGSAPRVGEVFKNPEMAVPSALIAEKGPRCVLQRRNRRRDSEDLAKLGGTMTAEDLAAFSSEWVEPISIDYRGWRVYELPPNSQGIAALEMLNIMETSPPPRRSDPISPTRCTSGSKP